MAAINLRSKLYFSLLVLELSVIPLFHIILRHECSSNVVLKITVNIKVTARTNPRWPSLVQGQNENLHF